jgi:hypothetical protein
MPPDYRLFFILSSLYRTQYICQAPYGGFHPAFTMTRAMFTQVEFERRLFYSEGRNKTARGGGLKAFP